MKASPMDNSSNPPSFPGLSMKEMEWEYNWRREMQEIIPGLYLGPYAVATKSKLDSLRAAGITHIVCVRHKLEANIIRPNFPEHFTYLVLDLSDCERQNLIQYFPQVNEFIANCLQQGGKVLVHGNGGISRSPALVIAFIMQHFQLSPQEAYLHVQKHRFCICLNQGFVNQLKEYEPIYKAQLLCRAGQQALELGSVKRKWEEEHEEEMSSDSVS